MQQSQDGQVFRCYNSCNPTRLGLWTHDLETRDLPIKLSLSLC